MGYCLSKAKLSQGFSVAKLHSLVDNNSQINLFVWDSTEPVATRPLFMLSNPGSYKFFYTFDGNKNVSELVHFESRNGIAAHYDYAPFGSVTRAVNTSAISARNFVAENPFRFSSEYHDDTLGLVYYNYRHYNPMDGRWLNRDPLESDNKGLSAIIFCLNNPYTYADICGLIEHEVLSSHEVSILPMLGGTLKDIESKIAWKNVDFNIDWSVQGKILTERRKCCEGPRVGQIVTDQVWDVSFAAAVSFSIATVRDEINAPGVRISYWWGAMGEIGGGVKGYIKGESDTCSGKKRILTLGSTYFIEGQISGGGNATFEILMGKRGKPFLSYSLGVSAGLSASIGGSFLKEKHGNGPWRTTRAQVEKFSVTAFVQIDEGFASYRYEHDLTEGMSSLFERNE